jgi:hypothetical protein
VNAQVKQKMSAITADFNEMAGEKIEEQKQKSAKMEIHQTVAELETTLRLQSIRQRGCLEVYKTSWEASCQMG